MPKKRVDHTPSSTIRAALRRLWLRSRERQTALKRDSYTCQKCGLKQSRAAGRHVYVEVHHKHGGIDNWAKMIEIIREQLLCSPAELETLCQNCHEDVDE